MLHRRLLLASCVFASACASPRALDEQQEGGEGEASTQSGSDSGASATVSSGAGDEAGTSDDASDASSGADDGEAGEVGGTGFVDVDMYDDGIVGCDINAEFNECPEGQKCIPYKSDPGASWWDSTGCFDIAENPVPLYADCTWDGPAYEGGDNCEEYAYCRATGVEGVGQCIGVCRAPWSGSGEVAVCEDAAATQYVGCQSCFCECMPNCDPLLQDCPEGQACLLNYNDGFMCEYDGSGEAGQIGDECLYSNACDPGNVCVARESMPEGSCAAPTSGCCSTFCDLGEDTCEQVIAGTTCQAALENPAEGFEHIGICLAPV